MIAAANVTTPERAESLLSGSHVSRCHWAHQVTAAALYKLLCISYDEYKETTPDDERLVSNHPQFSYWYKTYQLILLYLQFLRAQREQNYQDYVQSLLDIFP